MSSSHAPPRAEPDAVPGPGVARTAPGPARPPAGRSRWQRPVLVLGLGLVALAALVAAVGRLAPEPSGPAGSSYATSARGIAAYADLVAGEGHEIERLRELPSQTRLDPRTTLVVTNLAELETRDMRPIRRFVEQGGRLVAAGREAGKVLANPPRWRPVRAGLARPRARAPETYGVSAVLASGEGIWRTRGSARPALSSSSPGGALLVVARIGRGRVALLADGSPLANAGLARADNAALGLALAGERGRRVVFAEGVHGYGAETGLGALPDRALWALGGLLAAAIVLLLSRARRFGPPEADGSPIAPPRAEYVQALAGAIDRSRRPGEGVRPVRARARELLARRAGLGARPTDAELRRAAEAAGLAADETAAVLAEPHDRDGVLAAGRALSRLWAEVPQTAGRR